MKPISQLETLSFGQSWHSLKVTHLLNTETGFKPFFFLLPNFYSFLCSTLLWSWCFIHSLNQKILTQCHQYVRSINVHSTEDPSKDPLTLLLGASGLVKEQCTHELSVLSGGSPPRHAQGVVRVYLRRPWPLGSGKQGSPCRKRTCARSYSLHAPRPGQCPSCPGGLLTHSAMRKWRKNLSGFPSPQDAYTEKRSRPYCCNVLSWG